MSQPISVQDKLKSEITETFLELLAKKVTITNSKNDSDEVFSAFSFIFSIFLCTFANAICHCGHDAH